MKREELIQKVFRNRSSMYTAICLRNALEETILKWVAAAKNGNLAQFFLDAWIEENGTLLIQGTIRTLDPEAYQNVQKMDAREIWRKYWNIRKQSPTTKISLLVFIGNLNRESS